MQQEGSESDDAFEDLAADWGKAKYDYYYTDYVDKDYPSSLTHKEERLARLEQEEALRLQKNLLSTFDNIIYHIDDEYQEGNTIDYIQSQNRILEAAKEELRIACVPDDEDENQEEETDASQAESRQRRPVNMAIIKNRGLAPYKKKEYRNPRVKHKIKYKKALSKRRHLVKEAQTEHHRYSGETTGIKTSTIRSIKLC